MKRQLMAQLGAEPPQLLEGAYVDLLAQKGALPSSGLLRLASPASVGRSCQTLGKNGQLARPPTKRLF
jgi:hypothetical protein